MELIDQKTKKIMEECKEKAKIAGLEVRGETLEYITTNQDLLELSPKAMIPTLYDYWIDDIDVIRGKWLYSIYPHNPYETVINTRPAISFYNDNNPDWFNVMIFYHVLGHIHYFQNNIFFRNTWADDFCGQALADKRLLNRIREEMGAEKRWVDYAIEFARGIDNLVGYYPELEAADAGCAHAPYGDLSQKADFYFGEFLRRLFEEGSLTMKFYHQEIDRYNACQRTFGKEQAEDLFFNSNDLLSKFPEFNGVFEKSKQIQKTGTRDIFDYLMQHSTFMNTAENRWMKDVMSIVRRTSLFFQAQIRTHSSNEGYASYWHEKLFLGDDALKSHEVDYARVNSAVVANPKIGFNPYAVYKHLFEFIEDMAVKGKLSHNFQLIQDRELRKRFDQRCGAEYGKDVLLHAAKYCDDAQLVNFLSDDDFQEFVDRYKLFVAGARIHPEKFGYAEVYVKSRSGKDYRKMLNERLYHPPYIVINEAKAKKGELYLDHVYEKRTLVTRYVPAVLIGLSYLFGETVKLETTEFEMDSVDIWDRFNNPDEKPEVTTSRVLYTCKNKSIQRQVLAYVKEEE